MPDGLTPTTIGLAVAFVAAYALLTWGYFLVRRGLERWLGVPVLWNRGWWVVGADAGRSAGCIVGLIQFCYCWLLGVGSMFALVWLMTRSIPGVEETQPLIFGGVLFIVTYGLLSFSGHRMVRNWLERRYGIRIREGSGGWSVAGPAPARVGCLVQVSMLGYYLLISLLFGLIVLGAAWRFNLFGP